MAHRQQKEFCVSVKTRFPTYFNGTFVLDVGSFDVNGNNRYLFDGCGYIGVDLTPGKNVDICCAAHELKLPPETFDVVITTECAEHDRHYEKTLQNILRMLKPGGLLVFTCATTGRPEHGTRRTTPGDAPPLMAMEEWGDYYRNITEEDFRAAVNVDHEFAIYEFSGNDESKDLYFWGLKKGRFHKRNDYSFLLPAVEDEYVEPSTNSALVRLEAVEERLMHITASLDALHRASSVNSHALCRAEVESATLRRSVRDMHRRLIAAEDARQRDWRGDRYGFLGNLRDRLPFLRIGERGAGEAVDPKVKLNLYLYPEIVVLATRHTNYVARLVVDALKHLNIRATIIHEKPEQGFSNAPHFVIAPQMFPELPGLYVAIQMEQSISTRWFTPQYLKLLEHSFAILDYSVDNIKFLTENGLYAKQIYYMPISCLRGYERPGVPADPEVEVLFYGDPTSARRLQVLEELRKHFKVDVVSEVYGEALYRRLARAKIVVNVHYYENALLETTRIHECLSLGKVIVSERGSDQQRHQDLAHVVDFVDVGDTSGMIGTIRRLLDDEDAWETRQREVKSFANSPRSEFLFYFMRFLLAVGEIDFDQFYALAAPHFRFESNRICLGLPEYRARQEYFDTINHFGFQKFPGLRHDVAWIGCGMSYKFMMMKAREQGYARITICEDDVEFVLGWEGRFEAICNYLESCDDWDVFAGLIADLHPDTMVSESIDMGPCKLARVNKMVSMVFNVYNNRAFDVLSCWDPSDMDPRTNTIDRFIERNGGLEYVTCYPFLVGHCEDLSSTIWGFGNSQYNPLIQRSSADLLAKIEYCEAALAGSSKGNRSDNEQADRRLDEPTMRQDRLTV